MPPSARCEWQIYSVFHVFSDFAARIASWGQANNPLGALSSSAAGKGPEALRIGDRISFSDEGLHSLKQAAQAKQAKDAERLARNDEVNSYLKATYATMEAMKNLAELAQDENLTDEDRRAANPDGYIRMGELNRIFKPLDNLWKVSRLWDDGAAKYLIV